MPPLPRARASPSAGAPAARLRRKPRVLVGMQACAAASEARPLAAAWAAIAVCATTGSSRARASLPRGPAPPAACVRVRVCARVSGTATNVGTIGTLLVLYWLYHAKRHACGAASNVLKFFSMCSSSSRIDATLPHLCERVHASEYVRARSCRRVCASESVRARACARVCASECVRVCERVCASECARVCERCVCKRVGVSACVSARACMRACANRRGQGQEYFG
jgi:hypothetical protein